MTGFWKDSDEDCRDAPEEMLRAVEEQSEPTRAILMGVERASECSSWLPLVRNR